MSISNATRELVQAIFDNDPHRVSACLARGADVNVRGEFWQTPLFLAAPESKDRAIAEELLARGADVRARDEHDYTPLHITPARKMRKTPARTASVRLQIRRRSYLPG